MAANDKETIALHQRNGVNSSTAYEIPLNDLKSMMENRGKDTVTQIHQKYGDVDGLCKLLKTSPTRGKWCNSNLVHLISFL